MMMIRVGMGLWFFLGYFFTRWAIIMRLQAVEGCLLSERHGWTPMSLEERSRKADVVLTAHIKNVTSRDDDNDEQTYEAEVQVVDIFKGQNEVESVSKGTPPPDNRSIAAIFNVSNFGAKSLCYSSVSVGRDYILLLTVKNGTLTAKYDDIYGAAAELNPFNVAAVLKGVGLGYWSDWTTCSATCGGGRQERQRLCSPSQKATCLGVEKERRKCNTFECQGIRDLLKIFNFAKPGRRGVRPLTDRPGAFRIDRSSHLRLPTYTLFPYSEYFPATFSLLTTVRISDHRESDDVGAGSSGAGGVNFLGITDERSRRRMALRLGGTKIEFAILDEPAHSNNGRAKKGSAGSSVHTKQSKPNYFRLANASVADFQWHAVSVAVQRDRIDFYVDCELHSTFSLTRTFAGADISVASILTIGYLPNTIKDLNFEGDVEQLLIVTDSRAAEGHCKPATKVTYVETEGLVMDESYLKLPDKEVSSSTSTTSNSGDEWIVTEGSGDSFFELEWSEWSSCSVTCGRGHRKRSSYCLDNGRNLEECIDSMKEKSETKPCLLKDCPPRNPGVTATKEKTVGTKPSWSASKQSNPSTPKSTKFQHRKSCAECQNGGTCISKEKCLCPLGYYGHRCEQVNCLGCFNGGRCVKPNLCTCQRGFKGNRCQEAACEASCKNGGRCVGLDRCICSYGYAPPTCTPICNPPCYNGGTCLAPSRCRCAKGFAGNSCKIAICKNGCKNGGHCVAPERCACSSGYTGNDCSTPVCEPMCQNSGLCVTPYTCLCKLGFGGMYCEKFTCNPRCSNGGTCVGVNKCACPSNYIGNLCETDLCSAKCENGGKCVAGFKCSCPAGFHGDKCEIKKCKKFQTVKEPFVRSYKKKVAKSTKDVCGPWNWKNCPKPKVEYEIVSKTFYRTTYKCVD